MKIGIDIRAAIHEPAGIGTLTLNLAKQLCSFDRQNEYYLYGDTDSGVGVFEPNVHSVVISSGDTAAEKLMWHVKAIADIRNRRLDRFISFGSLQIAAFTKGLVVLVIPDLSHILLPEFHVAKSRLTSRILMKMAVRNARSIVAISQNTKKDILQYMKGRIDEKKISVSYAACEDLYRRKPSAEELARVKELYGLDQKYILTVGTLEPRKNIPTLIRAFAGLVRRGGTHSLVLAGKKGWMYNSIFEEVKKFGLESRVKFLGFVPLSDMPSLYAMADVFVYPSLYEGFGIPPLEAMTCGVPVITSNVASLPEVTNDSAILIDPHDSEELSVQLGKLLGDPQLREHYAEAGRRRAQRFSWRIFADHILSTLQH